MQPFTLEMVSAITPVALRSNRTAIERRTAESRVMLRIHREGDPDRGTIEACIRQRYLQRYGARIQEWLPHLVSLELDGEIVAAAGYRSANAVLYLERYLRAPVETCLADCGFVIKARADIVEAGQFVAMRPGAGRLLVPLLARHLRAEGFHWVVSTVTAELRHMFRRMGMHPVELAIANASLLTELERGDWGSYYEHKPVVVAEPLRKVIGELEGT